MKRKTDNFSKFYNKKRNSAIKEEFRQEKKAAKKERKEGIERRFEEKRLARGLPAEGARTTAKGRIIRPAAAKDAPARPTPVKPGAPVKAVTPVKGAPVKGAPIKGAPTKGTPVKGAPIKAVPANTAPAKGAPAAPANTSALTPDHLPLNKYIAHSGICSRRDAADLIRKGKVTVNGKSVIEPGTKVLPTDLVKVNGKKITISRNFVYILLNKPKDYITTTDDPQGRRTVLDLIRAATTERVYPVGRLDRNTSGVLLLTNDGDLAQKLAHPSHEIKKIYHVTLDDGPAPVDDLAYPEPQDKTQIGIEIHSGRNRIVRRIFEHLKYDVRGLDRVMYAGLTKKNVQRGMWRYLSEKEVRILKYLNSSIKGSASRAPKLTKSQTIHSDAE